MILTTNNKTSLGEMLKEWYSVIISYDFEQAAVMKEKIEAALTDFLDSDKRLLKFYELLIVRYKIMTENLKKGDLKPINTEEDNSLNFYFHFFSGQTAFQKKNYSATMRHYNIAETFLTETDSEIEKAEFHFQVGQVFYKLAQYDTALYHIEKSKEVYEVKPIYKEKVLNCQLLEAAISSEKGNFYKAEDTYNKAIEEAIKNGFNWTTGLLLRGKSFNWVRTNQLEAARDCMAQAFEFKDFAKSKIGNKAKIDYANILFRLGENKRKGQKLLDEGWEAVEQEKDTEYMGKAQVNFNLYVDYNEKEIFAAVKRLYSAKYNFSVAELSSEVADVLKERGEYSLAVKYLEYAFRASTNIIRGDI
ncbi:hypothetical protein ACE106_15485 [Shouchella clausii]|uniref:response regulator aspartate phosphatase n=1 Tax=Shouchella clausii TaxID=79880 RepID=UPI0028962C86|nr:hypothetical protein [Shouchella clausii]